MGFSQRFVKPAAGWTNMTETARLTASDGAGGDFFGTSIAMSGDTIVVGSPQDEPTAGGAADFGSTYVFVKPAAGWSGSLQEVAKLTASDAALGDIFGWAVAISGPTVVVGPEKGAWIRVAPTYSRCLPAAGAAL